MIADNGDNSTKHHTMHKHTWTYAKKPNQKHKCFVPFEIYHQCPIYDFRMTWSFYGQEQWGDPIYYAAASFASRRGPMVITTDHMWANIAKQSWPKCVDCLNGFESLWSWWSMTIGHGVLVVTLPVLLRWSLVNKISVALCTSCVLISAQHVGQQNKYKIYVI